MNERLEKLLAAELETARQNLRDLNEIRNLFWSFVKVISSAIDERTPYNLTHTRHMAEYGERFAEYINQKCREVGKEEHFSPERKEEFLMAIWLHDIGKLVIPLRIMNKNARLTPEQSKEIAWRMEKIDFLAEIRELKGEITKKEREALQMEMKELFRIIGMVSPVGMITDEQVAEIKRFGRKTFVDRDGTSCSWLTKQEIEALTIRRGTFTEEERRIMENHVTITDRLMSKMAFPAELSHVREWAAAHHEFLDGSGYPKKLSGDQIPYEARMITILDIFDALTADDRPYKPGIPVEQALEILKDMAEKEKKLDPVLVGLYIEGRCWENAAD